MILADWTCPTHGRFESPAPSHCDSIPCPSCGAVSPWAPSVVHGSVRLAEVERGKSDGPPTKAYMDTRALGEGMPLSEWRAKRDRMWEERSWKESKELAK